MGGPKVNKDYSVVTWADGFARWHAKAVFSTALGNLPEADAIAYRAIKACKVAIRREISERMAPKQCRRLTYQVTANSFQPGSGRLESITISEN